MIAQRTATEAACLMSLHGLGRRPHLKRYRLVGFREIGVPGVRIVFAAVPPLQGVIDLAAAHGGIPIVPEMLAEGDDVGQLPVLAPIRADTPKDIGGDARCAGSNPGHDRDSGGMTGRGCRMGGVVCYVFFGLHRDFKKKSSKKTTPEGFEPSRAKPNGLAGRRLNHSAKVSFGEYSKISR